MGTFRSTANRLFDFNGLTSAFKRRLNIYSSYNQFISDGELPFEKASLFMIICLPADFYKLWKKLQVQFSSFNIVYSSSPLQDGTYWIEILPRQSSKSQASQRLCEILSVKKENLFVLGNDFNDHDLLEWASHAYVVKNAPDYLREKYHNVASHDNSPLTEAYEHWISFDN